MSWNFLCVCAIFPIFCSVFQASKSSPEEVQEQVETLLELMSFRAHWQPADELLRLGGITMLLQVIAFAYEWNYSGRSVPMSVSSRFLSKFHDLYSSTANGNSHFGQLFMVSSSDFVLSFRHAF